MNWASPVLVPFCATYCEAVRPRWRVRSYEPADAPRCCEVINDAIVSMDGLNDAARARIRSNNVPDRLGADLARWVSLVIESEDGRVVGVGALDDGEIKRVYIDPTAQGKGAAAVLMMAIEELARKNGLAVVHLDASPSSVGFYELLGFLAGQADSLEVEDASFHFVRMSKDVRFPRQQGPVGS